MIIVFVFDAHFSISLLIVPIGDEILLLSSLSLSPLSLSLSLSICLSFTNSLSITHSLTHVRCICAQVLYASVRGNLYEVNQRLVDHPELLSGDNAQEVCYLAIIMPKRDEKKTATEKLLNQDEYNELLAKRAATAAHGDASHMQSEDDVAALDSASTATSLPADADTAACTSVDAE